MDQVGVVKEQLLAAWEVDSLIPSPLLASGLVFLVEKLGTATRLAICPIRLLARETSLSCNSKSCFSTLVLAHSLRRGSLA